MSVSGDGGAARTAPGRWMAAWLALACAAMPAVAHAEWIEVASDHFVIYGDQKPETLRAFAERLEFFHAAMAQTFNRPATRTSPSNRVSVYVVESQREVRALAGMTQRNVAGVYVANAGHSFAIVPKLSYSNDRASQVVLYHEYAHHFMHGLTSRAYPIWFVEGFAEFFATADVTGNEVGLGIPAEHREYELAYANRVAIRQLLEFDGGGKARNEDAAVFYGKAWALFHYLFFEHPDWLVKYRQFLAQGQPALQAAEQAFGDLDKLNSELRAYVRRDKLRYLPIPRSELQVNAVQVRALGAGEAAIMPTRMRSRTGVTPQEAQDVVVEARRVASRFPDDPAVQTALAEAEVDSGNFDAAIAAADRALAIDTRQMNAWVQKGFALTAKAQAEGAPKEAWNAVRSHWVKANRVENDNPIPLLMYFQTFVEQGVPPTPNAVKGLEWALALAPFDGGLRWAVSQQMIRDGRLAEAATTLEPLAYSPHPGENTDAARKLLAEVRAKLDARDDAPDKVSSTR